MPPGGRTITIRLTTEAREAIAKVADTFLLSEDRVVAILVNEFFSGLHVATEISATENEASE